MLSKSDKYYDTVRVTLAEVVGGTESNSKLQFEYLVVCEPDKLRSFDINFLVLFGIAVGVVVLAIKTPPLMILREMTEEE